MRRQRVKSYARKVTGVSRCRPSRSLRMHNARGRDVAAFYGLSPRRKHGARGRDDPDNTCIRRSRLYRALQLRTRRRGSRAAAAAAPGSAHEKAAVDQMIIFRAADSRGPSLKARSCASRICDRAAVHMHAVRILWCVQSRLPPRVNRPPGL